MTLSIDTHEVRKFKPAIYSTGKRFPELSEHFFNLIVDPHIGIQDVILTISEPSIETEFSEADLTALSLELSNDSFNEYWANEDDEYWNSY